MLKYSAVARFSSLLDVLPDAVAVFNHKLELHVFNYPFLHLATKPPARIKKGIRIDKALNLSIDIEYDLFNKLSNGQNEITLREITCINSKQDELSLLIKAVPLSDEQKGVCGAMLFIKDMSAEANMQSKYKELYTAEKKARKKAEIAGNAASVIIKGNLIKNYDEIKPDMRQKLVKVLQMLDPHAAESFIQEFRSEDEKVRFNSIKILSLMDKTPEIEKFLQQLITDKNEKIRATAVAILKTMPENLTATLLSSMLKDNDKRVVANSLEVIETIAQDSLVPMVVKYMKHPNNRIRGNAVKAAWKMGHKDVYQHLKEMVEDQRNPLMRCTACWVIGECATDKDMDYLKLLSHCSKDGDDIVKINVIRAMQKIGGEASRVHLNRFFSPIEISEIKKRMKR
ncbi:MAG: HEAT repeat domain-containing protein [Fibrobacteria bacterium]|nr:HEAT repeat domain-containing protein [Fibrobacteria bacterium]